MAALKDAPLPPGTVLAGGLAVGLHLGHRRSHDFDFFAPDSGDERRLARWLEDHVPGFVTRQAEDGTLLGRVEDTGYSLFRYPYPALVPPAPTPWGFGLASRPDLGVMKLAAVADRGLKRDFIDLWFLLRDGLRLEDLLAQHDAKYGQDPGRVYHLLRSLAYFADADPDPMPEMLAPCDWEAVKASFREEAPRVLREGSLPD